MKNSSKKNLRQLVNCQLSKQQLLQLKGGTGEGDCEDGTDDYVIVDMIAG